MDNDLQRRIGMLAPQKQVLMTDEWNEIYNWY